MAKQKKPPRKPLVKAPAKTAPKPAKLTDAGKLAEKINAGSPSPFLVFGGAAIVDFPVFPTGIMGLDTALGIGGWPLGRVIEIFGPESSGKTTTTLLAIAQAQRLGLQCAFIDAEHALDIRRARALGVDVSRMLLTQPDCGEDALESARIAIQGGVKVVVIDSVAALTPRVELEGSIGDAHVGLQARMMGQALRLLTRDVAQYGATVFFINQVRQKIGVFFGSPDTTPGGNALKFYATIRINIRRKGKLENSKGAFGDKVSAKVIKNKLAPPFQEADWDFHYKGGVAGDVDAMNAALSVGAAKKTRGGAYELFDGASFKDDKALLAFLADEENRSYVYDSGIKPRLGGEFFSGDVELTPEDGSDP